MKKKFLALLPVFAFSLTACPIKNENAVMKINVIKNNTQQNAEYFSIDYDYFTKMVENKNSFIILLHTDGCHLCTSAKSILSDIIKEDNSLVYALEVTMAIQRKLEEHFPDINLSYPNMLVFKKGEISHQFDQNNLIIDNGFRSEFKRFQENSNVYFGTEKTTVDNFVSFKKDLLVVAYDSTDSKSFAFVRDYVLPKAENSDKTTLLVDNHFVIDDFLTVPVKNKAGEIVGTTSVVNTVHQVKNVQIENVAEFTLDDVVNPFAVEIINGYY